MFQYVFQQQMFFLRLNLATDASILIDYNKKCNSKINSTINSFRNHSVPGFNIRLLVIFCYF